MAIEEPPYRLRLREGSFEVRDYPDLVVAEVAVGGDQKQAVAAGFRRLAGYIFGGNNRRESIAMTAPVTQTPFGGKIAMATSLTATQTSDRWTVNFTMPRRYSLGMLPTPKDAGIHLRVVPQTRAAVLRFSGLAQKDEVQVKALELDTWIRAHHLRATGPVSLAQYDPPWTLWFLRRNEVMIPVAT